MITDKLRDDEDAAAIENDWKFAAMVLDRLCLITFTAFTVIATVAVLAAAPHVIQAEQNVASHVGHERLTRGSRLRVAKCK